MVSGVLKGREDVEVAVFTVVSVLHGAVLGAILSPAFSTKLAGFWNVFYLLVLLVSGSSFLSLAIIKNRSIFQDWVGIALLSWRYIFLGSIFVFAGHKLTSNGFPIFVCLISWLFCFYGSVFFHRVVDKI